MVFLGKIVKVRGIKGEVVIAPSPGFDLYTPQQGEIVILISKKYQREFSIEHLKEIRAAPTAKFNGVNSIRDALKLVGYSLYSQAEEEEQEESVIQFTVKDVNGETWGTVKDLMESGLNQLLEVEDPEGHLIYVPISDAIIKSTDPAKKLIVIDPPDGLRDLNKT
ncbi:MAG: 16S rRNA processing protein RimM [bacterium]|nr:16S rRNA processing protein RimM [bacterium]